LALAAPSGISVPPVYLPRFLIFNTIGKRGLEPVFVLGIFLGGVIAIQFLANPNPVQVSPALAAELKTYGISNYDSLIPTEIFNWTTLLQPKGLILMVVGGFLVGFGTRYAGGCTSGHAITGLSNLQWPSLVATICLW